MKILVGDNLISPKNNLLCVWTAIFLAVTSAIRAIRAAGISAQQLLDDEGPWEDWWR